MRVVVFFAILCCLLLRGYTCIYTGTYKDRISYSLARNVEAKQRVKFTNKDQGYAVTTSQDEETEYLICDNIEDEDTDNGSARKYKLLIRRYLTPSHTFSYLYGGFKDRPFFLGHLSNKYITQRVLRI